MRVEVIQLAAAAVDLLTEWYVDLLYLGSQRNNGKSFLVEQKMVFSSPVIECVSLGVVVVILDL